MNFFRLICLIFATPLLLSACSDSGFLGNKETSNSRLAADATPAVGAGEPDLCQAPNEDGDGEPDNDREDSKVDEDGKRDYEEEKDDDEADEEDEADYESDDEVDQEGGGKKSERNSKRKGKSDEEYSEMDDDESDTEDEKPSNKC
ncbi:hypothetical protein [Pseudobacteriovorax antillogorgiicola]|uniref:Uncharacterized protein n=1 Tax=Pseudobacteriovorax antillogorgiicola TaxID=1513793 RepID=A0A1Y6CFA1_9BACT|nr:hypothetical protein [Pseudobacteriovorax antillogorgiicola]TCS47933.1 hypothetical protein EDD56_11944 [Pseudobacteriovorax antillogorgiicola]SMF58007.1 hypothetical protein SAMN06296036_11945 [Pseudobacteriovorax antillogorgiicola]